MAFWEAAALHALEGGVVFSVLAFTDEKSLIRPALLPLLLALSLYAFPVVRDGLPTKLAAGCVSMNTAGTLFQYIDFALISRWSYAAGGPTSANGGQRHLAVGTQGHKGMACLNSPAPSIWHRIHFGWFVTSAWRAPATPWEVKNVPSFSSREPDRVPEWSKFLRGKILTLVICLLAIDLLGIMPQDPQQNAVMFARDKVGFFTRLEEVSAEEVLVRLVVTTVGWTSIYCVMNACYCTLAIGAVATGLSPVKEWPPLFGSLSDCSSIRSFWG